MKTTWGERAKSLLLSNLSICDTARTSNVRAVGPVPIAQVSKVVVRALFQPLHADHLLSYAAAWL